MLHSCYGGLLKVAALPELRVAHRTLERRSLPVLETASRISILIASLLAAGACGGDPQEAEAPKSAPAESASETPAENMEAIDATDDVNDEISEALAGTSDEQSEPDEESY